MSWFDRFFGVWIDTLRFRGSKATKEVSIENESVAIGGSRIATIEQKKLFFAKKNRKLAS